MLWRSSKWSKIESDELFAAEPLRTSYQYCLFAFSHIGLSKNTSQEHADCGWVSPTPKFFITFKLPTRCTPPLVKTTQNCLHTPYQLLQ